MLRRVLSKSEHLIWAFFSSWAFISEHFYRPEHLFLSIFIDLSIYIWAYFSTWAFLSEHIFSPEHFYLSIFFHLSIIIWALLFNWELVSEHFFQAEHFKKWFSPHCYFTFQLTIPDRRGDRWGGVGDIYFVFCVPIINHQPTQTTMELHTCHVGARWCGCILTKISSKTKIVYSVF